jgi:hypothetical protein
MSEKEKKIKCPSCANEHDLNDYPGAFEIPCSCGYSILVPDVNAFLERDEGEETRFENRVPTSMEAEDEAEKIKIEPKFEADLAFEVSPEMENEALKGSAALTPSEKLPAEMAYDPFEVENLGSPDAETQEEINSSDSMENREESSGQTEYLKISESSETSTHPEPTQTVLENIVLRNQLGSFGQLLGPDYKISIEGLSRELKVELIHKTEELLSERPWLDEEIRKRKIRIDSLVEVDELSAVPEILCVEVYLNVLELGGTAKVSLVE